MSKLFNKRIEPSCAYCQFGVRLSETEIGCVKRGIVDAGGSCRKFRYDPLRREPAAPAPIPAGRFTPSDFSLDDPR